jgi:outer membrane protein assembly factor BamB
MIYFGAYDGRVFRLDTSVIDGTPQVVYRGEDEITSVLSLPSPDPARGSVWLLLGSLDEWVRIVRGDTGEVIWERQVGGDVITPPEIEDDQVIVGTTGGSLFVLALEDGALLHQVNLPGPILSLTVQDAIVFVGMGGEKPGVSARSLPKLESIWDIGAYVTAGEPDTGILIEEGYALFGDDSGRLTVLQAATGKMVWDYQADGAITALPIVVDGEAYVGDAKGNITMLTLRLDP